MHDRFQPLLALAGFIIWALAFLAIYAAQNLGCRFGWGDTIIFGASMHQIVLTGLYLTTLIAIAMTTLLSRANGINRTSARQRFFYWLALAGNISAFGVSLVIFAPALFLAPC